MTSRLVGEESETTNAAAPPSVTVGFDTERVGFEAAVPSSFLITMRPYEFPEAPGARVPFLIRVATTLKVSSASARLSPTILIRILPDVCPALIVREPLVATKSRADPAPFAVSAWVLYAITTGFEEASERVTVTVAYLTTPRRPSVTTTSENETVGTVVTAE